MNLYLRLLRLLLLLPFVRRAGGLFEESRIDFRALPTAEFLAGLGIHASSPEMPEVVRHWRHLTDLKKRHTDQGGAS